MKKRIEDLVVAEKRRLNQEFFVLKLFSEQGIPEILPGQFAEVRIDRSSSTFLRRPISFYDINYRDNTLELLIKIVGAGTSGLAGLGAGEKVNLVYPLGNHFSKPGGKKVLLVGGGTGVAPMLLLGKYLLNEYDTHPVFLLGYRSDRLIIEKDRFEDIGKVHITTEDGSEGFKGFVTQHPVIAGNSPGFDQIYTCGPEIMMKAIALLAKTLGSPCEVSLENLMGCGIGACLCCAVDTRDRGHVNTCTDGPVFNSEILKW
jgi:dihydroorotate dehydrogenase electron transfer subunit